MVLYPHGFSKIISVVLPICPINLCLDVNTAKVYVFCQNATVNLTFVCHLHFITMFLCEVAVGIDQEFR